MKKNFIWMLAAILLCGTMTTVLTACGDDDDDDSSSPSSSANVYEVTLSALLPRCSAPYMKVQLEYTDADGKSQTVTVQEGDQSQTISDAAMDIYKSLTNQYRTNPANVEILDNFIVRNFTMRVPAGKSYSYEGTVVVRNDFSAPEGKVNVIRPCVISTAKRISGNSADHSDLANNGSLSIICSFGIAADSFESIISRWDGRDIGSGSVTMK